jgi:putative transposase
MPRRKHSGLPIRLIGSPGHRNDIAFAHDIVDGFEAELYKKRNRIERFFNKLKQLRRVATGYDKILVNFMGFVKIAAITIWLK